MLGSIAIAFVAIFGVVLAWMMVDRLFRKTMTAGPKECDLPRRECCHCIIADSCSLRDDSTGDAD